MSDLNSPDWATANLALRHRRDEMDRFKRMAETIPMANDYDIGRAAAQRGAKAPPKADNSFSQEKRDAGFDRFRNPPPAPRPVTPTTTRKY